MCEDLRLLLSTLSKCWRGGERTDASHCLREYLFRQIWDIYFYVVCTCLCGCIHLWGCTSQYGELDPAQLERQMLVGPGCWDLSSGPHYWAAIALNHLAIPLALDLQFWKWYSFLLLLTYFKHFQSLCSKMNSGLRRHGVCPEIYHLLVGKQLFWDRRWERSSWIFFLWLLFVCLLSLWNNIDKTSFPVFIFFMERLLIVFSIKW